MTNNEDNRDVLINQMDEFLRSCTHPIQHGVEVKDVIVENHNVLKTTLVVSDPILIARLRDNDGKENTD